MYLFCLQLNAKQNAEKKYLDVLQKEGLDEEDLIRLTKPKPGKKRNIKNLGPAIVTSSACRSRHGSGMTHSVLESVHSVTQATSNHSRMLMTRTNSISMESEYEGSYASEFQQ